MLTGERVTLRPIRADDLPTMYAWRIDLSTWEMTTAEAPFPITWELYQQRAEKHSEDATGANFAVEVGGELAGRAGLFGFDALTRSCEVGLHIAPEHRGKGYGTETLRLLVDFGFRRRNLHRIHLSTLATNEGALRCYRRAGFVEEGRRRQSAWVEGAYVDEILMSRLVSD